MENTDPRDEPARFLRSLFDAAVAAADPLKRVPSFLPERPKGRVLVVGAGKASARMALAVEQAWGTNVAGLVVTRYGHGESCAQVEVVEAGHPVPDASGLDGARRILDQVCGLDAGDLVLALISGGGSSLLTVPREGISLADKRQVTEGLLRCGASIDEINVVRKHLSAIKGGRLAAAAYPAATVGLLMSDVPGDDPGVIASGPTVGEVTTPEHALRILREHGVDAPLSVVGALQAPGDCPAPDDPRLARTVNHVVAAPQQSLEAAAEVARRAGVTPVILGDALEGEAREVAGVLAGIVRQAGRHGQPAARPCVLLSGGETTVTVRGDGCGGRNVEFLLALAVALRGLPGVHAIACDTDGIDGVTEVAGAVIGPDTLDRARETGVDPEASLADNDGHTFFRALGDQVITGPTLTNVNDFRAILVV